MRKCYDLAMRHPILLGLVVLHLFLGPRAQENKPPDLNALLLDLDRLELGVRREAAIGLSHQKQLPASFAWFEEVRTFRHSGEVFLHLRKRYDGTGHFSEDLIRSFSPPDSLVEVEVQRPLGIKMEPGEDFTGGDILFADDSATFDFHVWVKGDANCCPSGGRIVGSLKYWSTGQTARS
jgi:hypothetical protein